MISCQHAESHEYQCLQLGINVDIGIVSINETIIAKFVCCPIFAGGSHAADRTQDHG